ncbi:MAG: cyclopropane-fatty-acyl-phospholipid synthase family protein [Beijerinckiaceae bacterium]|jgi:cyclopropane-fatty-acyl-phospholipid synthase|nr:cyclopropane-fatty-acyl-phospholipid synthase family protein [Beijerinckiaceae bacterium]
MNFAKRMIVAAESVNVPDFVSKAGIRYMVSRSQHKLNSADALQDRAFLAMVENRPIAVHTDKANEQHYEIPAEFYELVLGPHRKYSSCLFEEGAAGLAGDLASAEARALAETVKHAGLADGQSILEMGCGWGSLSLYMAGTFPNARIIAVSNSRSQREYIEGVAAKRGLANLQVITCDMNSFQTGEYFDRIVSVEMFEHMSNWRKLLEKARGWLNPDGRMFLHVFSHKKSAYLFDENDKTDWIAQHFFTGGIMPSHSLIREFSGLFQVEEEWRWNGRHYEETARQWLVNFDANSDAIAHILRDVYGADALVWQRRWRLFFLATMGLFGHADGTEWAVSHYRLSPVAGN